jgi:hypothetical protein
MIEIHLDFFILTLTMARPNRVDIKIKAVVDSAATVNFINTPVLDYIRNTNLY